jgi:membrane fusion protein, multidrug efflux system
MPRKILLFIIGFVAVLVAVAGPLFLAKKHQFETMGAAGAAAAAAMPPTVVTAVPAKSETWGNSLSAPGSFEAVQGVTLSAEVPGKVTKIGFEPGAAVKAGDMLVQLDVSAEDAQLRAAEATAALAKANLDRARELRQNNTNSPAELDAADATAKQAAAQVENVRAILAKKTIRAPFAGRLGLRQVNLGQILREGTSISTLQTLDPIYVNFWMPQQRMSQLTVGTPVEVTSDAALGEKFIGKITAISPEVDLTTRNILAQATIPNREEKLRPGMFGNVDVILPTQTPVLTIPVTGVIYAPFGDSVFVIEDKKDEKSGQTQQVLRQQFIRIGGARGDFVNVVDGLKPGQMVVSAGVFKLRPGTAVRIDNKLAIDAKLNPTPENK